ncbi:MAG: adaptor protein MecA, partial [Hungatella sp.]
MKIERINDNQIRCTLSSFDLSVRNLNLVELAYGSEKARGLFREMIQKASNEVGFEAEDIPLMVEAIPLSNESVMLVITKIDDPEELDTRFAKFSPFSEEDSDAMTDLASELLEGADGLLTLTRGDSLAAPEDLEEESPTKATTPHRVSVR